MLHREPVNFMHKVLASVHCRRGKCKPVRWKIAFQATRVNSSVVFFLISVRTVNDLYNCSRSAFVDFLSLTSNR